MMRTFICVIISVILESRAYGIVVGDCSPPEVNMPCVLHKFTGNDCSPVNLKAKFSFYETNTAMFPGQPGSFSAVGRYRYHPDFDNWYQEVNLTFTTPQSVAKNYVKGFEVTRYDVSSNRPSCYILDLSNVTWNQTSMAELDTKFPLDLYPLNPAFSLYYVFEVYALPKQENRDERFDHSRQLTMEFPTFKAVNEQKPRNWIAAIYYSRNNHSGTINATIEPPPSEYGMTLFEYSLSDKASDFKKPIPGTVETSRKLWHEFTRVPTGEYQIWVKPMKDGDNCPCKDLTGQVCSHCATTKTRGFYFNNTGMPSVVSSSAPPSSSTPPVGIVHPENTITTTPPVTRKSSESGDVTSAAGLVRLTTESPTVSALQIAMAVVGTVLGIALAIVVAGIIYYRKCRNSEEEEITKDDKPGLDGHPVLPGKNPGYADEIASIMTFPIIERGINNENADKLRFEKRPKLCLLFEEDHEYHRAVVENFATYLQQHCQCDSMCVEWQLDAPWVHEDLNQADFVIIVNSEGAYTSYMAKYGQQNNSTAVNQSSQWTRRMSSINSVRNKFLRDERYDNIVMVYFDYTEERYILPDICQGYKYRLPKHFNEFLLHIHKLHRTDNLSKYDLPFDSNHNKRPIGRKLLESIVAAEQFQQQNPKWFQKRFGYDRMWSHTSDDSKFDSGITEDFNSPGNTPQIERPGPFEPSPHEAGLLDLLESKSVVTVNPSDIGLILHQQSHFLSPEDANVSHIPKSRPKLSPQSFTANPQNLLSHQTPSPPTCSTVESRFSFIPPDDFDDDFDVKSRTQSEQMRSIVDRYQANLGTSHFTARNNEAFENIPESSSHAEGYDRNQDLLLLQYHSGDVPFIACNMNSDVVSLGGESV